MQNTPPPHTWRDYLPQLSPDIAALLTRHDQQLSEHHRTTMLAHAELALSLQHDGAVARVERVLRGGTR